MTILPLEVYLLGFEEQTDLGANYWVTSLNNIHKVITHPTNLELVGSTMFFFPHLRGDSPNKNNLDYLMKLGKIKPEMIGEDRGLSIFYDWPNSAEYIINALTGVHYPFQLMGGGAPLAQFITFDLK